MHPFPILSFNLNSRDFLWLHLIKILLALISENLNLLLQLMNKKVLSNLTLPRKSREKVKTFLKQNKTFFQNMTNRREYTAEFKLEAVKLVKETGQTSTKIAKDLGIYGSMLSKKI